MVRTNFAAASLQSCPTLCDPMDCSLPGFSVHGILQARILEWVAISFSTAWKWKVKVKSISCVWLLATPWTAAYPALPSMGFSRQEYWSGLPLPSPKNKLGRWNRSSGFSHVTLKLKYFQWQYWAIVCCLVAKLSDSLWPDWLQPARLLCPWDFPGKDTGVGCHFLLQGIFLTQDQTHISYIGRWILYSWATK